MKERSKALRASVVGACIFGLLIACASPRGDRYAVVIAQRADQPSGFSNTPSSVIVPGLPMRYAVGFNDYTNVFDASGRRLPGSSAMGFAYSDDSGETWRAYKIPSPLSTETVTVVGSASVAVGEIPAREPRRPSDYPVYYAVTAISGPAARANRVYLACSTDRGQTFSGWTSVPVGQYMTVDSPSLTIDRSTARLHLAFVADQGTASTAIEQWDATYPADRSGDERASRPWDVTWTLIERISEDPANRQYVRHPIIQFGSAPPAGSVYLVYEIRRPVTDPNENTDSELRIRVKWFIPRASWVDIVPGDSCCTFLQPHRFRSRTLEAAGGPAAREMAQMDFVVVPTEARNKGIIVWSGVHPAETGRWQSIHYEEFIIHENHFRHEAPPEIVFSEESQEGLAFLPTAAGIGEALTQGSYGVRAVSWYHQQAADGRIRLMGALSRATGLSWETPRNLTALAPGVRSGTMPLCATLGGEWGRSISSLMFTDLSSLATHALVFNMNSRGETCDENNAIDNRVRYQEVGATRWLIDRPRR